MTYVQVLERTDPRLGRHVRHDPRSKAYPFQAPLGSTLRDVAHQRHAPIFNQSAYVDPVTGKVVDLGSCTGNATVGALASGVLYDALVLADRLPVLDEDLAVGVYSAATRLDDVDGSYPPTDTGSDGLSVAKVATSRAWIAGYRHAFSLADFLAALQVQPVIVGTVWLNSMFTPSSSGLVAVDRTSGVAGGHEYLARSYRMAEHLIGFDNSWGAGWGAGGSFWMRVGDFASLLEQQGDATVFTPLSQPPPTPRPSTTASVPLAGDVAERVAHVAAQRGQTSEAWLDYHLRSYFHLT